MKKLAYLVSVMMVLQLAVLPASAGAVMAKPIKGKTAAAPMDQSSDGYSPDSDPLPEWLFLPDGVDENGLSYTGSQASVLGMKQPGSTGWEIETKKDGSSIEYRYFETNKLQFAIKTNKDFAKMTAYVPGKKGKLKRTKSIDAEKYFDANTPISLRPDDSTFNFSLTKKAYAVNPDYGNTRFSQKRVKAKLSKRQINKLNHRVGFKGNDARIANKVAFYESGGGYVQAVACENNTASGFNTPYKGVKGVKDCKRKGAIGAGRGLYQISSKWHPGCSSKCAFSSTKNAKYAYKLRKQGGWTQWCSYGGCGSNDPNGPGQGPAMN